LIFYLQTKSAISTGMKRPAGMIYRFMRSLGLSSN